MHRDFTLQKRAILLVVVLLVAADLGMAIYSWQLASAPSTPQREFDDQNLKLMVLKGDIDSAKLIKDKMPATRKDCEKFEHSLPPAGIGTSSVISELDDIAKKSGLQIDACANAGLTQFARLVQCGDAEMAAAFVDQRARDRHRAMPVSVGLNYHHQFAVRRERPQRAEVRPQRSEIDLGDSRTLRFNSHRTLNFQLRAHGRKPLGFEPVDGAPAAAPHNFARMQ